MKKHFLIAVFSLPAMSCLAQNLINGDLEGPVITISTLPPAWDLVQYTDFSCDASGVPQTTPDLTSFNEPAPTLGVFGQAFSGETFISGLASGNGTPGDYWQEGIKQEVTGFTPNEKYVLSFYQAVVKQSNGEGLEIAIDTSGSWIVYMDDDLIGISVPSVSHLAFDDPNLNWDYRSVAFVATQESHVLKFLPFDDDLIASATDESGGIRMGIDLIEIGVTSALNFWNDDRLIKVYPNPTSDFLNIALDQIYNDIQIDILNAQGQIVLKSFFADVKLVKLFLDAPKGLYLLRISLNKNNFLVKRIWKE